MRVRPYKSLNSAGVAGLQALGRDSGEGNDDDEEQKLLHGPHAIAFGSEVFEYLVGSAAFKAAVGSDPVEAGSIPVHLR